jgi:hypothetical protein
MDIAGTPNALTNNQSVSKNTSLDNVGGGADLSATTDGTILNNNGIATALSTTVAIPPDSLGVSTTITAATTNATIPSDAENVKLPKNRKAKKQATTTVSPTPCNPKQKKNLDDAIIDTIFPNPSEVEDHVLSYVCNWAQAIVCNHPECAAELSAS